jgi:hypothetical protein
LPTAIAVLLCVACAAACQGTIGDTLGIFGGEGPAGPGSGAGGGGSGGAGRGGGPAAGGGSVGDAGLGGPLGLPPVAGMRRLTSEEYSRSLRDLVGASISVTVEPDTRVDGFFKVGASQTAVSPLGTELYYKAAYQAIDAIWSDVTKRAAWVDCDPSAGATCARQVIARFGRRAWRRPLTSDELDRYANLAVNAGDILGDRSAGLQNAMAGVLQSPHFLYRLELGEPDPTSTGRMRYPDHEIAMRLSYFLIDSLPDEPLLAAADRGELATVDGIRAQAKRILDSPAGRESIRGFARDLFNLPAVDVVPKDPALYPEFTPALRASMREEVERMWETAAFTAPGGLLDVFTTRETFVDDGLAAVYGLPPPGQGTMVATTLPDSGARAGVLGTGAFLSVRAKISETTPTLRGRFVREVLMCQKVPDPPPNVNPNIPPPAPGVMITRRQQLEQHRTSPSCAACHSLMDTIGLTMENFDAIGRYRDMDRGLPIDASGTLDGVPVSGPRELGQRMRESAAVHGCMMRNLYRYALGANESSGGEAWIPELERQFDQSGQRFADFALALVTSDLFRYAAGGP